MLIVIMIMIDFKVFIYVDQICNSSCLSVCLSQNYYVPPSWAPQARSEAWEVYPWELYPLDDPPRPSRPKAGLGLVVIMMAMIMMIMILMNMVMAMTKLESREKLAYKETLLIVTNMTWEHSGMKSKKRNWWSIFRIFFSDRSSLRNYTLQGICNSCLIAFSLSPAFTICESPLYVFLILQMMFVGVNPHS